MGEELSTEQVEQYKADHTKEDRRGDDPEF
jgi:hypothetical protein